MIANREFGTENDRQISIFSRENDHSYPDHVIFSRKGNDSRAFDLGGRSVVICEAALGWRSGISVD